MAISANSEVARHIVRRAICIAIVAAQHGCRDSGVHDAHQMPISVKGQIHGKPFTPDFAEVDGSTLRLTCGDRILPQMEFEVWLPADFWVRREDILISNDQRWTAKLPTVVLASNPRHLVPPEILHEGYELKLKIQSTNGKTTVELDFRADDKCALSGVFNVQLP